MPEFTNAEREAAAALIALALPEDLADAGDVTSRLTIDDGAAGEVAIVSREPGVVCGLPIATLVASAVDKALTVRAVAADGEAVRPGDHVCFLSGPVRSLLTAERTVLNFMTHLSGVASLTAEYIRRAAAGGEPQLLDTRKTLPGWRRLAKYAVRCGGGHNHRMGLFDAVLVKDNHIASWRERHPNGSLAELVADLRRQAPDGMIVEVEVDTQEQLADVLGGRPDIVLLDNMPPDELRKAISVRDKVAPGVLLEASGGVNLETIEGIASSGVDRISVGALTHSAKSLDLGFDWVA